MAKKTYTFATNDGKVFTRESEKQYTHVVLHIKGGVVKVGSWHTSEDLAAKKVRSLRTCVGSAHFADRGLIVAAVDSSPTYHPAAATIGRMLLKRS